MIDELEKEEKLWKWGLSYKTMVWKMGYGVDAYFSFQCQMILLFLILTLISVPNVWVFNDFDGGDRSDSSLLYKASIGQLGFAKALCWDTTLDSGLLNLKCYTGEIRTIHSFGIIPSTGKMLDACEPNKET